MTFRVETTAAAEKEADAILDWLLDKTVYVLHIRHGRRQPLKH
jgi:plasmid stabilization system protein ParE